MTMFTVHHAKTNLSKLIADTLRGDEVVIARGKEPVVKLVPVSASRPRRPGRLKGRIALTPAFFDPLPHNELDAWSGLDEP